MKCRRFYRPFNLHSQSETVFILLNLVTQRNESKLTAPKCGSCLFS